MNRREMLIRTGTGAAGLGLLSDFPLGWAEAAPAAPGAAGIAGGNPKRKLLFFTKSSGFQHGSITRKDGKLSHAEQIVTDLGAKHGFEVTASKDGTLFNPDKIGRFDAFLFYTTGDLTQAGTDKQPPMTPEGKAALIKAVEDGKGFLGTHSATDTFHTPKVDRFENAGADKVDPYIGLIGAEFIRHGAQQKATMRVVDKKFPGFEKVDDFVMMEEWYSLKDFAKNMHVLLVQETKGMVNLDYERPPYPATWARKHGKGRVFYTSMGHREDVWTNPTFQTILLGGLSWAFGLVEADVTPNLESTCPNALTLPKKPEPKKVEPKKK